jgi:hypothetical protein
MTVEQSSGLSTGWEPGVPAEDTALRRFVLALADSLAGPVAAMGGRVDATEHARTSDLGRPATYYDAAVLVRPPAPDRWDTVLDAVERRLFSTGTGEVALFSPWPTPDLTDRGWTLEGHPPFLLRNPGGLLPPPAPGVDVVEVRDAEALRTWERIVVEGYPMPELRPWRPGVLLDPAVLGSGLRMWLARLDGEPVGAAASYVAHGLHVLSVGVVLPEARGRGVWRTLLGTRLATFPDLPAAALFSDLSRPGAERHGFVPITRFTLWTRERP